MPTPQNKRSGGAVCSHGGYLDERPLESCMWWCFLPNTPKSPRLFFPVLCVAGVRKLLRTKFSHKGGGLLHDTCLKDCRQRQRGECLLVGRVRCRSGLLFFLTKQQTFTPPLALSASSAVARNTTLCEGGHCLERIHSGESRPRADSLG